MKTLQDLINDINEIKERYGEVILNAPLAVGSSFNLDSYPYDTLTSLIIVEELDEVFIKEGYSEGGSCVYILHG